MDAVQRANTYMYIETVLPLGRLPDVLRANPPVNGFCAGAESFCGRCCTALLIFVSQAPLEPLGFLMCSGMGVMLKYVCV